MKKSKTLKKKSSKKTSVTTSSKPPRHAKKTSGKKAATASQQEGRLLTHLSATANLRSVRFAGVSLGGGKTDKTAVALLEYFPDQKRVFLRNLFDKVSTKGESSADEGLLAILENESSDLWCIAVDAPLQFPIFVRFDHRGPGGSGDEKRVLDWMRKMHDRRAKEKRPNKMFTPYTERAAEIYIANELEEPFHPSHALGSNAAPLAARAHFLKRSLKANLIEVYPKLSLWRIGCALDVPKSYLRFHRHAIDSDEARHYILSTLMKKEIAFIYQQDLKTMVDHNPAFEAFLCALTGFLKYRHQTQKAPPDFPKSEIWIDFPVREIHWF